MDLRDYSILIHGEKKIGKTSILSHEEGALYLEFDPIQRALQIYQRHISSWPELLAYLSLLEKGGHGFKTLVIDGVNIMYQMCFAWKCKQLGIEHPHDENDYGKSWNKIKTEFSEAVRRILNMPGMAPRFISHSTWKEVKAHNGIKVEKLVPLLPSQAEEVLVGEVDLWIAYCYAGNERIMVIDGDEEIGAGHRIDFAFQTPSGEKVVEIPAGASSKEAYQNLVRAFNNKQTYTHVGKEEAPKAAAKPKLPMKKKLTLPGKSK